MPDVAAMILAAGGSTRLGSPKQLVEFERQTLVRRAALAAMSAGCSPVAVVVGAHEMQIRRELSGLNVIFASNPQWQRGIGSSIRAGMTALLHRDHLLPSAVLINLCDQPLVDAQAMRNLMDARVTQQKEICVSTYADTLGPPVLAGAVFFEELCSLPDDQGAKALWLRYPTRCALVPCPAAVTDIDTPADVIDLKQRHA